MAEFKISRLRYTWKGVWASSIAYNRDDVVRYGGGSWVCVRQHTASEFADDLAFTEGTQPLPAWTKMTDGYQFRNNWAASTLYNPGDTVLYGGVIYLCVISHTAESTFAANQDNWTVYVSLFNWTNEWVAETRYGIGDLVKYGGIVYRCTTEHTAGTVAQGLENDQFKWSIVHSNIEYRGEWVPNGTRYKPNDLVKYGGSILRCTVGHTTTGAIVSENFAIEFYGFNFNDEWDNSTYYAIGDFVKHGGYIYRANNNNYNSSPDTSMYQASNSNWSVISKGINFAGNWTSNATYKSGDIVRRGGNVYVALVDSSDDGSSLDYLDSSNWEILIVGSNFRANWITNTQYFIGDYINFAGNLYSCNFSHVSSSENYPGDNGSGFYYWDLVLLAGPNVAMDTRGDLLTFDFSRTAAGDTSTIGTTPVRISQLDGELLMPNAEDSLVYNQWGEIEKIIYVSSDDSVAADDITDPQRGFSVFKPFRTIRFACEYIEHYRPTSTYLHTIKVSTGDYTEILPIVVPAGTAVRGEELRSVTVKPNPANESLNSDSTYMTAVLNRISAMVESILITDMLLPGDPTMVSPPASPGNTETPINNIRVSFVPPQFSPITTDELGFEIGGDELLRLVAPSMEAVDTIKVLISQIVNYINYHVNDADITEPTLTGSNDLHTEQGFLDAAICLDVNREFFIAEAVAYMQDEFSFYEFDLDRYQKDIARYIDAWIYDLQYDGNYKSLRAARYYRNLILGSAGEDMFYVRDATGIRNMTLSGLIGTLPDPAPPLQYQIPTGGAFVSLDPGWGPTHEEVWITTRSCYVQNVTTFGYAAIGQKIDGALHNGGNKSIVSNDFTQVISDGIGAWVSNNGRAELVSVFSYYAHIGMFADNGGKIRATNGNSSYGTYGTLADGNDPTESPTFGVINNRLTPATVVSALAGEANDEILLFEFGNAGEQYTTAEYRVVGSGVNASVIQEEFRDNAVFEFQVRNSPVNVGGTPGGGGYSLIGNNAQSGTSTTITLASSNENTEEELLGLRVIITSGDGTGQYGYVGGFNELTKVVNIFKETNGEPGWDHVVQGTPILGALNTSAVYRFEPRLIVDEPPYVVSGSNLITTQTYASIIYGETQETFIAVPAELGSGTTINVIPSQALFNISKVGRNYTVTLSSGGAGYADEQLLIIPGSLLGGTSPENNITITVKSISDDSTNSILTFEYEGVGVSGKFIAMPAEGNAGRYSYDGTNWTSFTLPSSGDWYNSAAGENTIVAIQYNSNQAASSTNGINWTARSMPAIRNWTGVAYGSGIFVAIADDSNIGAYSLNGTSWVSTTLPAFGDSTRNEWVDITYGKGKFVAVANSGNTAAIGTFANGVLTWAPTLMDVSEDSSALDWQSVAYGNQRFVVISSTGQIGYSFDGITWLPATMPSQDGSTAHFWRRIRYGQGVFFAIGNTGARDIGEDPTTSPTQYAATSYDGIHWTPRLLSQAANWASLAFGNPDVTLDDSTISNNRPMWVLLSEDFSSQGCKVLTGARALGRVIIESGRVRSVRIWEPGSGYDLAPSYTIIDPNNTTDVYLNLRMGDKVLAQPSWINRGVSYKTSNTSVVITGDGYADIIPNGNFVTIQGVTVLPGPGTQFRFRGEENFFTVTTVEVETQEQDGTYTATFRVSPRLDYDYDLEHGASVEIRERYSQVRITGHDFLDIGAGNFVDTNYPELYTSGLPFFKAPENEVVEFNGGRVFYTSTDQDGNFRAGELFAVEQSTGVVTISADFFNLEGLTELALGGVRLGGSGAVVREFSTDALFVADSNNVVPTQRAIKAYLQNRLNVGGADLLTASFIAGTVRVGPNLIGNTASLSVLIPVVANFAGIGTYGRPAGMRGSWLAQIMFIKSFKDR